MKHLSSDQAIDFVNHVIPLAKRTEVQEHLDSGCKRCAEIVALWQRVREATVSEVNYQPPASALRIAKAAFATAALEEASGGAKLLFDSLLQPAAAGVRSTASDTRQLLYSAGPYLLDVYISAKPGGRSIAVTGQLFLSKFPERILNAVPIIFSNRMGTVIRATTNKFGEFQGEVTNSGHLELRLPRPKRTDIIIPLGTLVAGLSGTVEDITEEGRK
jgi:hypothetical protein